MTSGILKAVRRLIAIPLMALGLLAASIAAADQNDPRLDPLFDALQGASDAESAQPVERAIWQIWLVSDNNAVNILMRNGMRAMERRDYRAALRDFDQIVKIAPDFAEGWNKRATVNYLIGQYEDSLADIGATLKLEPRHFGALSGRGLVLVELDRTKEALDAFEAALRVYPQMPGARSNAEALRKILQDRSI